MFSSIRLTFFLLATSIFVSAAPTSVPLDKRSGTVCGDKKPGPCICNDAIGLRLKDLSCPNKSFKFKDGASATDGTLQLFQDSLGNVACDHIVELQIIAKEIKKNPAICAHFQSQAGKADFKTFFDEINDSDKLVFVEKSVNTAKGFLFEGKNFGAASNMKIANGVASYLKLVRSDAQTAATSVKNSIDGIMQGISQTGFSANFVSAYVAEIDRLATKAQTDGAKLPAAPAQGDIFVDETASTIARCQRRRSLWLQVRDYVVSRVTGKKTTAAAACTLPPKKTTGKTTTPAQPAKQAPAASDSKSSTTGKKTAAAAAGKKKTVTTPAKKVAPTKKKTTKVAAKAAAKKTAKKSRAAIA
ncbi:hypothetical protein V5O48_012831 [Marasmius crinis-equi]|uniref:Uncharacterized protein n=1 Tax=Marasmius crinis-equi TaxID=585013 RepID=A0ABR3F1R5_9AGAR